MNKSIHQIAAEVIKQNGHPMTAQQIYQIMVDENLYNFKAKNPANVVRSQLRRHTKNVESKNKVGSEMFVMTDDGKFELA